MSLVSRASLESEQNVHGEDRTDSGNGQRRINLKKCGDFKSGDIIFCSKSQEREKEIHQTTYAE